MGSKFWGSANILFMSTTPQLWNFLIWSRQNSGCSCKSPANSLISFKVVLKLYVENQASVSTLYGKKRSLKLHYRILLDRISHLICCKILLGCWDYYGRTSKILRVYCALPFQLSNTNITRLLGIHVKCLIWKISTTVLFFFTC